MMSAAPRTFHLTFPGDEIERCLTWLASVGVTVDRIDEE